ncbi:hypothetical protein ACIQVL_21845 [Streptomyces sp. NPDC090499]|uniref:hypothetical protein n=1 Tax=Streptomyces sp. NPDC090499 TaxID=3365965 RepID=UPI0037F5A241
MRPALSEAWAASVTRWGVSKSGSPIASETRSALDCGCWVRREAAAIRATASAVSYSGGCVVTVGGMCFSW